MSRWIRCFVFNVVGAVVICTGGLHAAQDDRSNRPNVIVLLADDLGYADVGAQGISADVKTPNIDSIAVNGVRFTDAYVTAPVCAPSRAGLMTGRYQQRFGFELNPGGNNYPNYGLPQSETSLAEMMRRAGYGTGMMGKWHLGNHKPLTPLDRGFEEFFGFWGGLHAYNKQSPGFNAVRSGDQPVTEFEYLTDAIGREAASFIDRHHAEPFFLYVAFNAVHSPMQAPKKYVDRFEHVTDHKRKMMLAMLSAMDDAVGQILEHVRARGLEERTLIFFATDNGGPTDGNASRNTPFSGYKAQLFEGGIRVPFFAQWKGRVPAGRVIHQPVHSLDIFTTAIKLAGAKMPVEHPLDGVDLMPVLEGTRDEALHERLFWRYADQWAVREGDWKLLGVGDYAKLFNLADDPAEKRDRAAEKPEIHQRLLQAYAAWAQGLAEPMWVPDDPTQMDKIAFDTYESPHRTRERRGPGSTDSNE